MVYSTSISGVLSGLFFTTDAALLASELQLRGPLPQSFVLASCTVATG